jgi:hypothetical protein
MCVPSSAKRRKQKEWDQEWGRLNAEGHIWWRGDVREHWIDVMGDWWPGWICECFSYIPPSLFFRFVLGWFHYDHTTIIGGPSGAYFFIYLFFESRFHP